MKTAPTIRDTSAQDVLLAPKSRPLATVGLLLVGGLLFSGLILAVLEWRNVLTTDRSLVRQDIRVAKVTQGDLRKEVIAMGKVVVADSPTLFSAADGVVSYAVKAGDVLHKGMVMLTIVSPSLTSILRQEQATLGHLQGELVLRQINSQKNILAAQHQQQLAEIHLITAQRAYQRRKKGLAEKFVAEIEYERAQEELQHAQLAAKQAPENLALIQQLTITELHNIALQLERQQLVVAELERRVEGLTITSPVDGMVSALLLNQQSAVALNQPVITVVDLTQYEAEVEVPEYYAAELTIGMSAEIKLDSQVYPGEILAILPEVNGGQVKMRLRFTGKTPDSLRQNQRLTANIVLAIHRQVLRLPRGSYIDVNQGLSVFQIKGNRAFAVPIVLGDASVNEIEVLQGLALDDEVIVSDTSSFRSAKILYLID